MIQDDPINKLKSKVQGYFPLNLDSEEEIVLKDIEIPKDLKTGIDVNNVNSTNNNNNSNNVYYKYIMLIGLCNTNHNTSNFFIFMFRYNARNSTWFSFRFNSLHAKE